MITFVLSRRFATSHVNNRVTLIYSTSLLKGIHYVNNTWILTLVLYAYTINFERFAVTIRTKRTRVHVL